MVTFRGAAARCGHPAGLGAIQRFWRKIKQFLSWAGHIWKCCRAMALGSLQAKSHRHRRRVNSYWGAVGVLPYDGTGAIVQHCNGNSADARPPGDGLAAALQPSHDGAYEIFFFFFLLTQTIHARVQKRTTEEPIHGRYIRLSQLTRYIKKTSHTPFPHFNWMKKTPTPTN